MIAIRTRVFVSMKNNLSRIYRSQPRRPNHQRVGSAALSTFNDNSDKPTTADDADEMSMRRIHHKHQQEIDSWQLRFRQLQKKYE